MHVCARASNPHLKKGVYLLLGDINIPTICLKIALYVLDMKEAHVLLIFTLIFLLILLICAPPPPVGTLLLSPLRRHYDPGQKRKKEKGKEEKETSVRASTRRVTGSGLNLCFKTFSLDCL